MNKPFMIERIVSSLSYLTMGFVGFIYLMIGLITRAQLRPFTQYHIFQSIFLSIAFYLLNFICGFILNLLSYIPIINKIIAQLVFFLNAPLLLSYSLIQIAIYAVLIYLMVTSFMGKYSRIPFVSDTVPFILGSILR